MFLEAVNQVPDTSLEEISNRNLNTAEIAMNDGGGNAELTNDRSSRPPKTLNETSKMIETRKDDSEVVDLGYEKNTAEETEAKRERLITCRICEENEAVVAFKPCGHIILCTGI